MKDSLATKEIEFAGLDVLVVSLIVSLCFQAYSVYDEEIGYCQGLSFLAAALLLHVRSLHHFVCKLHV